ncbi:MAG: hypothetical protein D6696_15265 [Acidobacteria bacterium]|nr:MAG: hypothetical protein D6696_15265 [Acidobacteriota bacterium]
MNVLLPASLEEACDLLAEHRAVPVAGGTDLLVEWPQQLDAHRRTYLDLSALEAELRPHRLSDEALVLGALTTYWDVLQDPAVRRAFPLLACAARQVGAIQIQARGTWAGNVANASPAADGVPVLMAYDAVLELASRDGVELVPLASFYRGYKDMRRRPEQLIRSIRLPRRRYDLQWFEKVGSRRAQAITKVGAAVTRSAAGWRVVANSVAPTVCRCPSVERLLANETPIAGPADLLPALRRDVSPIDDLRSTAAYRERVLARVLYWGLRDACPWFR